MGPKALFDDDELLPQEQPVEFHVNEEFAKRFEHNKKREELQRLQEKYPEQAAKLARKLGAQAARQQQKAAGSVAAAAAAESQEESSSEEEEDPEALISQKTQAQIFETLLKIRAKDASIYQPEAKFYSSSSEDEGEEDEGDGAGRKKERPMYLKDIVYQQALQEGGTDSDEEERAGGARPWTYAQEQDELKRAFLSAFDEAETVEGDGGAGEFGAGVLKQRASKGKKAAAGEAAEEGAGAEAPGAGGRGGGGADAEARVQQLLDGYFGRDEELSKEDRFLKRYILNKGWVDEGDELSDGQDGDDPHANDEIVDEDEEELERAEQFEHAYNFRFEEPGATAIITYPRNVEGTVRKEDDRRKRKRQEKAERLAAEEEQRRAEVRRLKNLKKAEIEEKLHEIQSVAGKAAPRQEVLDQLVAGDFDPEEYDKQMAAAFGDDYYDADADLDEDNLADEQFEKELEAMAQYGSDDEDPRSFAALHKRLAAQRSADAGTGSDEDDEQDGEDEGEGEDEEGGGAADPEAAARARAEVQRLLEEYFKLDYEDVVGGIPTRFRYKEVQPDSFGLDVDEILAMDDRELNQVVGLKQLAPYREEHKRVRPNYGKLNELRKQRQDQQGGGGKQRWQAQGGGGGKWQQQRGGGKHGGRHGGGRFGADASNQQGQERQEQQGKAATPEKSAAERRLESFNKPSLKKQPQQQGPQQGRQQQGDSHKKRKREGGEGGQQQQQKQQQPKQRKQQQQQQQQQQPVDDGPKLSRAAKKNMKRSEKRAAKRSKVAGGEGGGDAA